MKTVFNFTLILFIGIGILMVTGQVIGLVTTSSEFVIKSKEFLAMPAYIFSSLAAILGFILLYRKDQVS